MKVAIAWYGAEGQSNYRYYTSLGHDVTIVTPKLAEQYPLPEGAQAIVREDAFDFLNGYDVVVRSAGIRPDSLKTDGKIWSATNEFFVQCPAPIIGVTGTKGKGTTSSFIESILKAAGKTVHLVGNIGTPALEVLPRIQAHDIVIFEISSFQLWDLEIGPATAVVLMIEPDHLDVHTDMAEYIAAKARIASTQTADDTVIYHPTNEISAHIASLSAGQKIRFGTPEDGGAYVKENTFFVQSNAIGSVNTLQVVGQHNIENACAAISAAWQYTNDTAAILHGLHDFTGLPHRLKFIREIEGVKYYDDNYSSAPGAAIAAVKSFTRPEILIMGGYDKKVDFGELASVLISRNTTKKILLIGQTRHQIAAALDVQGGSALYELCDAITLTPIVERAKELAQPGDVVVMSPACASFDMFKNFTDRGDQYVELVEGL